MKAILLNIKEVFYVEYRYSPKVSVPTTTSIPVKDRVKAY